MIYRQIRRYVEAEQYVHKERKHRSEFMDRNLCSLIHSYPQRSQYLPRPVNLNLGVHVHTRTGLSTVPDGDWVVEETVDGEKSVYVLSDRYFRANFEVM